MSIVKSKCSRKQQTPRHSTCDQIEEPYPYAVARVIQSKSILLVSWQAVCQVSEKSMSHLIKWSRQLTRPNSM